MKYFSWLWNNSRGIRWNTVVRIVTGIVQVVLSLLMVWLSKRFIDETIRTGTADDVLRMVELRQVLHTACADFVFNLPDGIDTELGERGCGLSEGQAQRIAIARGLLHGGDILLLDEISSSLDEPTEYELYHRLFTTYPQKTMLFITHRATITELCDEVIKM